MACAEETDVRSDLCQEGTVTESSECRLHSSIATTQTNIELSGKLQETQESAAQLVSCATLCNTSTTQKTEAVAELRRESAFTVASLSERYCNGVMGVPITYLDSYNPEEFEIVSFRKGDDGKDLAFTRERERVQPYFRILVRRR